MRTIKFLLARVIIIVPIVQMLLLVPAVTFDIKDIAIGIVDHDQSQASRQLADKFSGSPFFNVQRGLTTMTAAEDLLHQDKIDVILTIPQNFEVDVVRRQQPTLQIIVNGINGSFAQKAMAYCNGVIADFGQNLTAELMASPVPGQLKRIEVQDRFWYNPELDYKIYMAPGILTILVTSIGFLLAGLNLIREKEIGTSEQINVTPIKKHEFILGKLLPFLFIGILDLAFGLTIARLAYGLPLEGSLLLLFGFTTVYLIAVMGLGLFLSTFTNTQQQYLFVCFFFMMVFILMSGIFTPADSMPHWAQVINRLNPTAYFIKMIRMILLKGSGFMALRWEFISLAALALSTTALASMRYKKTA